MYSPEYFSAENVSNLRLLKNTANRALTVAKHADHYGPIYMKALYVYYKAKDKWAYAKKKRQRLEAAREAAL